MTYPQYSGLNFNQKKFNNNQHHNILCQAIEDADFIAFDMEFGFNGKEVRTRDTIKSFYENNREDFEIASVLQLGLTCFKYEIDSSKNKLKCLEFNSFSLFVIPRAEEKSEEGLVVIKINPSNFEFLSDEGKFKFNDYFDKNNAIGYLRPIDMKRIYGSSSSIGALEPAGSRKLKKIFNLISERCIEGSPLIVHQGLQDFFYLYANFIDCLPQTLAEFKKKFVEKFPSFFDTKILANEMKDRRLLYLRVTRLRELFESNFVRNVNWNDFTKCKSEFMVDSSGQYHDAGYDSFMTACVFIALDLNINKPLKESLKNIVFARIAQESHPTEFGSRHLSI